MPPAIQYLPDEADRVLIVTNPTAGARSNRAVVDELTARLRDDRLEVDVTSDLDHLRQAAQGVGNERLRTVVAAGGDGTVSAVANAIDPRISVAILPLGTENLLAKYLGISGDAMEISHAITHGATVALDAGQAGNRIFLLMAGCGFDAEVVRRLHARRRGHIRHLSYVKPILDSIRTYSYPAVRVYCEPGRPRPGADAASQGPVIVARWVFVVNLPCYAAGLQMVPHANGTDGQLDICTFEHGSLAHGLRYLGGIISGQHLKWSDCTCIRATKVRIESDQEVPYQIDGDPGGTLPLEITTLPGRVRLVVSERWAHQRGFQHRAS